MTKTETISSPANPLLRRVRRAVQGGILTEDGCCITETYRLLEEAQRSRCPIRAVVAAESERAELERRLGTLESARVVVVPDELFRDLAATRTSQGILALVRPPEWDPAGLFGRNPLVVVLDGLQDPGNAGAIVRAAEAFGATGVLCVKGATNPFNPKAVRASAGSVFRVPLSVGMTVDQARILLNGKGVRLFAATPSAGIEVEQADLSGPCAVIIGSEGHGVGETLARGATRLRIPTTGVESLNAAMAAGILLYEARRHRSRIR